MNYRRSILFFLCLISLLPALSFSAEEASEDCDLEVDLNVRLNPDGSDDHWGASILKIESATYNRVSLGRSCVSKGIDLIISIDIPKEKSISITCMAYPNMDSRPSDISHVQIEGAGMIKLKMHLYVDDVPKILDCVSEYVSKLS